MKFVINDTYYYSPGQTKAPKPLTLEPGKAQYLGYGDTVGLPGEKTPFFIAGQPGAYTYDLVGGKPSFRRITQ